MIDSHSHLNSEQFKDNWKNIVTEAKNAGLSAIINCGSDLSDSEWSIAQAQQEPIVYATVGIHPEFLTGQPLDMKEQINNLRRLISNSQKVVAVGEIGLDYTLDSNLAPKPLQIELIKPQLKLAFELNLPVILHVRDQKDSPDCFNDIVSLIKEFTTSNQSSGNPQNSSLTGVFHCWTGTPDQARQALDLGFYISFSGIVTYKSAGHIAEVATLVPDEKLLIETDAPFLTPEPARSQIKPDYNQPKYVILTAEKLAQLRQTTTEHISTITAHNAQTLFNLPPREKSLSE